MLLTYTACPATFDTLCEGYYSGVGGPTGQFVVYSGRGRFEVFFWGIMDPSGLMGRLSKIKSKIEKSRFWHFLYTWSNAQIIIIKYHFFTFSPSWGWERLIQTQLGTMSWVSWILAKQCVRKNRGDTGTSVPVSQLQFLLVAPFLMSQITLLL